MGCCSGGRSYLHELLLELLDLDGCPWNVPDGEYQGRSLHASASPDWRSRHIGDYIKLLRRSMEDSIAMCWIGLMQLIGVLLFLRFLYLMEEES